MAMGFAAVLALVVMKASLLALANTQWTVIQTLADAYLTGEIALSNRLPLASLTVPGSLWPDSVADNPPRAVQTVILGQIAGGTTVSGTLTRFRVNETPTADADTGLTVWRLHSVLAYNVGDKQYFKNRSTLRLQ